ncbi:MAG: GAF domain-containing protein [Dokdonella sp.]
MAISGNSPATTAIERLRLIAAIASGLHGEEPLDAILQRAADAIHEQLGFPNVDIPLIDVDDPATLVIRIRGGRYKERIRHEDRVAVAQGIMGAAVRERRTIRVNDLQVDPRYVCPPGVTPALAELAVPIQQGGHVLGVLNVEGNAPFDDLDQMSLEIVADFLGVAIHNAQLLPQARTAAILTERQRLARELHDNVTQILSAIGLLTQTLTAVWQRDPGAGEQRVLRLQQLAHTGFAEMRMLLRELAPPATQDDAAAVSTRISGLANRDSSAQRSLPNTLRNLIANMSPEELHIKTDFSAFARQSAENEETLYRVCQEALSNAIRHSRSTWLGISLTMTVTHCVLQVADTGCGIGNEFRPGIGLSSMRGRVEEIGGHFRVSANTPQGTLIEARLPRSDRAEPIAPD